MRGDDDDTVELLREALASGRISDEQRAIAEALLAWHQGEWNDMTGEEVEDLWRRLIIADLPPEVSGS